MKKTIYAMIIVSFVLGLGAITVRAEDGKDTPDYDYNTATPVMTTSEAPVMTTAARATSTQSRENEKFERIPSPEYIKFFEMIRKEGNTLFGIRRSTSTMRGEDKKSEVKGEEANKIEDKKTEAKNENKLEKIEHPALLNLFERIQKIGTALWGIKRKATSTPAMHYAFTPEVATCVATAIDVKDKALMVRVTSAATELNTALLTRSTCQQNTVKTASTTRDILNGCVKAFNEAQKTIRETSKQVQKESWTVYQDSVKACRPATSSPAIPMVEDGGNLFD